MTELFATKTGSKVHRQTCRFAKGATKVATSGKLGFCAVCKPHLAAPALPVKSIGKENLTGCKVCAAGVSVMSRGEATAKGFLLTPKGGCYHKPTCGTLKPKGKGKGKGKTVAVKAAPKAVPAKPKAPKRARSASKDAVAASVMSAIGL